MIQLLRLPGETDGRRYIVKRNGFVVAVVYRLDDDITDKDARWALTGEGRLLANSDTFFSLRDALTFIDQQLALDGANAVSKGPTKD